MALCGTCLDGASLEQIAELYFRQSEQIPTAVRLSVAELLDRDDVGNPRHRWRAGGLVAQFLPEAPERMRMPDLPGGSDDAEEHQLEEDDFWTEARALVETIEADELTDPQVGSERLLYRLFHERGARVYESQIVLDKCSCSREKISTVLEQLNNEQVAESLEDGVISVTCEFCSTTYRFSAEEVLEGRDGK